MTTPLPAHLVAAIRQRIAWLREAWDLDASYAQTQPRLTGYPIAPIRREPAIPGPTFPKPHTHDSRSRS